MIVFPVYTMSKLENMSTDSLKLKHEELKLFLQITWSGILTFTISLLIGSFTKTVPLDPFTAIMAIAVIILCAIIVTLFSFSTKFNEIREEINKRKGGNK